MLFAYTYLAENIYKIYLHIHHQTQ